ncbi:hypothetical protein ACFLUJ_01885 [Chloroflexota bacterium]
MIIRSPVLRDIGIHPAEKNQGSMTGDYLEKEGPAIVRRLFNL